MKSTILRLGHTALDLLFPRQCPGCGEEGSYLCASCEANSHRFEPPYCLICAQTVQSSTICWQCALVRPAIDGIRAPYLMEGAIREAIHELKYSNLRASAPRLGELLGQWLESSPIPGDSLVPVPLHKRRLRICGYNQSALLAKEVARRTGLAVAEELIVRTRDTQPQVSLSHEERIRNVEGSFGCTGGAYGGNFILVDDVVTTGSTLLACATALKAAGASSVWGIALAR